MWNKSALINSVGLKVVKVTKKQNIGVYIATGEVNKHEVGVSCNAN